MVKEEGKRKMEKVRKGLFRRFLPVVACFAAFAADAAVELKTGPDRVKYKRFLKPLGIKACRFQGGWAKCEKEKGKYDFSWLDKQVDYAIANGIEPALETSYGNPIYEGGGGPNLAGGFPYGEGRKAFERWVRATLRRPGLRAEADRRDGCADGEDNSFRDTRRAHRRHLQQFHQDMP